METSTPSDDTAVRRALLPEILFSDDVAIALRLSPTAARKALAAGRFGRPFRIGQRLAIRREALLETLEALESAPPPLRVVPHGEGGAV